MSKYSDVWMGGSNEGLDGTSSGWGTYMIQEFPHLAEVVISGEIVWKRHWYTFGIAIPHGYSSYEKCEAIERISDFRVGDALAFLEGVVLEGRYNDNPTVYAALKTALSRLRKDLGK